MVSGEVVDKTHVTNTTVKKFGIYALQIQKKVMYRHRLTVMLIRHGFGNYSNEKSSRRRWCGIAWLFERLKKDSFYWYKKVIESNGEILLIEEYL